MTQQTAEILPQKTEQERSAASKTPDNSRSILSIIGKVVMALLALVLFAAMGYLASLFILALHLHLPTLPMH